MHIAYKLYYIKCIFQDMHIKETRRDDVCILKTLSLIYNLDILKKIFLYDPKCSTDNNMV